MRKQDEDCSIKQQENTINGGLIDVVKIIRLKMYRDRKNFNCKHTCGKVREKEQVKNSNKKIGQR